MSKKNIDPLSKKTMDTDFSMESFSKYLPLLCAGAAVGLGIFALREIKNIKAEIKVPDVSKKMENMEQQLKKINEYLLKKDNNPVIKSVLKPDPPSEEVNIINDNDLEEYEEVEVTDSESED